MATPLLVDSPTLIVRPSKTIKGLTIKQKRDQLAKDGRANKKAKKAEFLGFSLLNNFKNLL